MSKFLTRLWRTLRHPTGFVGKDLEGNIYIERRNPLPEARRPKRTIKYRNEADIWDYIGGKKRLPAQWSAWLSHTRLEPPTMQELERDWARQQRLQVNVAMIEQRNREERLLIAQQAANDRSPQAAAPIQEPVQPEPQSSLPKMPSQDNYEPEAWAPRAHTRGS